MDKKICSAAYHNSPPEDGWDLSDLKLYHAMRLLYAEFGMMLVDREQAARERSQLVEAWRREKRNDEQESIPV